MELEVVLLLLLLLLFGIGLRQAQSVARRGLRITNTEGRRRRRGFVLKGICGCVGGLVSLVRGEGEE